MERPPPLPGCEEVTTSDGGRQGPVLRNVPCGFAGHPIPLFCRTQAPGPASGSDPRPRNANETVGPEHAWHGTGIGPGVVRHPQGGACPVTRRWRRMGPGATVRLSVRGDHGPASDIDLLVAFNPDREPGAPGASNRSSLLRVRASPTFPSSAQRRFSRAAASRRVCRTRAAANSRTRSAARSSASRSPSNCR